MKYGIRTGAQHQKTNLKKIIIGGVVGLMAAGAMAVPAFAAQPASSGCFGRDRAAYANANGSLGHDVGGVGYYASLRAGDNGAINQAYKTGCGGDPATP
jgi:hypothetical protein